LCFLPALDDRSIVFTGEPVLSGIISVYNLTKLQSRFYLYRLLYFTLERAVYLLFPIAFVSSVEIDVIVREILASNVENIESIEYLLS